MALTPRLDLRQTQNLVMTPQLQQAIKLLQFSSLELAAYVEGQLEQNPLLEAEDAGDRLESIEAANGVEIDLVSADDLRGVDEAVAIDAPGSLAESALDLDYHDNLYDTDGPADTLGASPSLGTGATSERGGSFDDHETSVAETLAERPTLKAHLLSQLAIDIDDPADRIIGLHLIDMLDDAGYLPSDLTPLAELLGCPIERIEATLQRVQHFDPAGVFARSLAECLALQLRERGLLDATMRRLLQHLDLVGKRDWVALARLLAIGSEQLGALIAQIRALNPKPALPFDEALAQPITPDVIMRPQPGGGWIIELNSDTLPRVLVNNQYYAQISRTVRKREDRQYINECLQSANWLVRSLHQRATTILKVATEIIRQQERFFVSGVQGLKPLILRDVAEAIGMHESTVSRVTANKFVSTPRGIYELKYFFTHAVGSSQGGDAHSAEWVRCRIKALIDAEDAETVLSDDALAEILEKEGIDIARRTVAKYREAIGLPSSVQRRREKGRSF